MMIVIRDYTAADAPDLWALKFHTIHQINKRDYTAEQLRAWAPAGFDMQIWQKRADGMHPYIAQFGHTIVGFADLQPDGYIDHFFCSADYQGCGVGKALMQHILHRAQMLALPRVYSAVSITAKPFYENFGFTVVKKQSVEVNGEHLTNFLMERNIEA
jgi:putative acetyltransferase